MASSSHPLGVPAFRRLFLSRLLTNLSFGFTEVPLLWWVLERTGSPAAPAQLALVASLGLVLAAPLGGLLADRGSKRQQILLSQGADVLLQLLLVLAVLRALPLPGVYLLVGLSALVTGLRLPALAALQPLLVPREVYQQANAAMSLGITFSLMASSAAAGAATGLLGVAGALLVGVALLALGLLPALGLPDPQAGGRGAGSGEGGVLEGLWTLLRDRPLAFLVLAAFLINLVLAPVGPLMAPLAQALGAGPGGYGLLSGSLFLGQLCGMLYLNLRPVPPGAFPLAALALGLGVGGLGLADRLSWALASLGAAGVAAAFLNILALTLLQGRVDPGRLGRVSGLAQALALGAQPLGLALASPLLARLDLGEVFLLAGGLVGLLALGWLWVWKGVRP
ncbi:MFS transporter [Thermus thermamylovorans]|uniref:MFS transporter n=1 Tax=Thermus thermamylovorans TaxID=2509362 RepID=A0A4Q9AZM4_9DEIN|nr:MFS transporter [Thermus thermamylovorans]TBH17641.1 MFS transporter [Thermus thermamylovorans]